MWYRSARVKKNKIRFKKKLISASFPIYRYLTHGMTDYLCGKLKKPQAIPIPWPRGHSVAIHWQSSVLPVVIQWQSSGNPVCLKLRPQCTLKCHCRKNCRQPVCFQCASSGLPVVFQCVPIMQINTGLPLGYHWVLESASVVPLPSQCTRGSSSLPVCSNYVN